MFFVRPNARPPQTNFSPTRAAKEHPPLGRPADAEQERLSILLNRDARSCARPHRALVTIAAEVIARYRREKDRRALARLRRPDRQDAGAVRALVRRLGALQARSRHRPRADRRGAGHQPQAVEHRAHDRVGIRSRRRAPQRAAHGVRGRRREAVDLLVPGRGAARLRRNAARVRQPIQHAGAGLALSCASTTRSAPARPCSAASTGCSARARSTPASPPTRPACRRTCRCPTPRPGWSSCGR